MQMIPPMAIDRVIVSYHFDGGGYVALVSSGRHSTPEMLDAIQKQIELKRDELTKIAARDIEKSLKSPVESEIT